MSTEEEREQRRKDPVYQASLLAKWRAEAVIANKRTLENAAAHDRLRTFGGGHVNAVKFFQGAR